MTSSARPSIPGHSWAQAGTRQRRVTGRAVTGQARAQEQRKRHTVGVVDESDGLQGDREDEQLDLFGEDQAVSAVPLLSPEDAAQRRRASRMDPAERAQGIVRVQELQARLVEGKSTTWTARHPCPTCYTTRALLIRSGNQDTVVCGTCRRHLYNAPRTETGLEPRTVTRLRANIAPGQQARILERDHGRCLLCGSPNDLTIGHLLSVADGYRVGATEQELRNDANLVAMCETCNAGLGAQSVSLRTAVIWHHLLAAESARSKSRSDVRRARPGTGADRRAPSTSR